MRDLRIIDPFLPTSFSRSGKVNLALADSSGSRGGFRGAHDRRSRAETLQQVSEGKKIKLKFLVDFKNALIDS